MAIRPLDMQVSVQQSTAVLKSNAQMANRADTAAHQFSEMLTQKTEQKLNQVAKTDQAEQNAVDKDGRGGSGYGGGKKKQNTKQKPEDTPKQKHDPFASKFDFTI